MESSGGKRYKQQTIPVHCAAQITIGEGRRFAEKVEYSDGMCTSEDELVQENSYSQKDLCHLNTELYKSTPFWR